MTTVDKFLLKWGSTLVILFVAVALVGYGCGRSYGGKLRERAKTQEQGVKDQAKRADSIRTVYVHDTVTAYRYLTEWEQITDTLRVDSLPPASRHLVLTADTTIRACTRALRDCDALQAIEHARADSALALAETYKKLDMRPWVTLYAEGLRDLAGGYVVGGGVTLGRRLALTARGEAALSGGPLRVLAGLRFEF